MYYCNARMVSINIWECSLKISWLDILKRLALTVLYFSTISPEASELLPPHMHSHLICTPTSYALPPHMYSHLICTPTSYVLPPHMYSHLICTPTSYVLPPYMHSHLICTPTSYALPPHMHNRPPTPYQPLEIMCII